MLLLNYWRNVSRRKLRRTNVIRLKLILTNVILTELIEKSLDMKSHKTKIAILNWLEYFLNWQPCNLQWTLAQKFTHPLHFFDHLVWQLKSPGPSKCTNQEIAWSLWLRIMLAPTSLLEHRVIRSGKTKLWMWHLLTLPVNANIHRLLGVVMFKMVTRTVY